MAIGAYGPVKTSYFLQKLSGLEQFFDGSGPIFAVVCSINVDPVHFITFTCNSHLCYFYFILTLSSLFVMCI